jgi:hypothetical protein
VEKQVPVFLEKPENVFDKIWATPMDDDDNPELKIINRLIHVRKLQMCGLPKIIFKNHRARCSLPRTPKTRSALQSLRCELSTKRISQMLKSYFRVDVSKNPLKNRSLKGPVSLSSDDDVF